VTPPTVSALRAPGKVLQALRFVASAWRAATWKHFVVTSLLALAWVGAMLTNMSEFFSKPLLLTPSVNYFLSMQFNALAVMLALLVADRASPLSVPRLRPYVLAVIAGVAVGSTLFWVVSQRMIVIPTAYMNGREYESYDTFLFRHGVHGLVVCGLAAYVYALRRIAAHRLAAVRIVQLEHAEAQKRILESRLAAMQARIDPETLSTTLFRIQRLYETDRGAADRMLRDLTTYLRCAIPQSVDPASTVAQEVRLANAFLNMHGAQARGRLAQADPALSNEDAARMPPMVLLPIVDHALRQGGDRAQENATFEIDVEVRAGRLLLTVRDRGIAFAPGDGNEAELQHVHERLHVLYGDRATLRLRNTSSGSEALLDIPHEPARYPG
jgi:sensor histidine kinase YesM